MKESKPTIKTFAQEEIRKELHIENSIDTPEFQERVEKFCREVLIMENRLDSGNFANVFSHEDQYSGLCFKKLKPLAEQYNSVHTEGQILAHIRDLSPDTVRTPIAHLSAEQYYTNDKGKTSKRRLLIMERIDGVTLRDIFSPIDSSKKKPLPENFNIDTYFETLRTFIDIMHKEKGVYHRDISMANLMIDENGMPTIIDFGESFWGDPGEEFDAYGRHKNLEENNEDLDIKKLNAIEENIRHILDKN